MQNFYDIWLIYASSKIGAKNKCNVVSPGEILLIELMEEIAARGMKGKKNGITFDT